MMQNVPCHFARVVARVCLRSCKGVLNVFVFSTMVLWGVTTALLTGPAPSLYDIPVHRVAQLIEIKPKSQYSLVRLHCLFQSESRHDHEQLMIWSLQCIRAAWFTVNAAEAELETYK